MLSCEYGSTFIKNSRKELKKSTIGKKEKARETNANNQSIRQKWQNRK